MFVNVDLTHEEIVGLMRSMLRSLPNTPENERELHSSLFMRLSILHVNTLPPGVVEDVGRALDGAIGR